MYNKAFINKRDAEDYSFAKQYLDRLITESPRAMDYSNAHNIIDSTGFSKIVVVKRLLSEAVCEALKKEGYSTNIVGHFTEIYRLSN